MSICVFLCKKHAIDYWNIDKEKDQVIPNENTSCNNIWWIWMLILTYVYIFFKIFFKKIILNTLCKIIIKIQYGNKKLHLDLH